MAVRDRVVLAALGGGAVVAAVLWVALSPWAALVAVLLALVVASIAYRVEPPRIDLDGLPARAEEDAGSRSARTDQ